MENNLIKIRMPHICYLALFKILSSRKIRNISNNREKKEGGILKQYALKKITELQHITVVV